MGVLEEDTLTVRNLQALIYCLTSPVLLIHLGSPAVTASTRFLEDRPSYIITSPLLHVTWSSIILLSAG